MKILPQEQELSRERKAIACDFYRVYEPSLARDFIEKLPKREFELGAGRHFTSFLYKTQGLLDLVVNVGRPAFLEKSENWAGRMQKLQKLDHPLLPPFELWPGAEGVYVMPYCEQIVSPAVWRASGLSPLLDSFQLALQAAGLALDDYWQLRTCRGHPFVTDFSDLISAGPFKEGPASNRAGCDSARYSPGRSR